MQIFNTLADLAGLIPPPPPAPEAEIPAPHPRTYDCTGCRFVDSNGLVCSFCLRKILDNQAEQKQNRVSLMAACFDGSGFTLLFGNRAAAFV